MPGFPGSSLGSEGWSLRCQELMRSSLSLFLCFWRHWFTQQFKALNAVTEKPQQVKKLTDHHSNRSQHTSLPQQRRYQQQHPFQKQWRQRFNRQNGSQEPKFCRPPPSFRNHNVAPRTPSKSPSCSKGGKHITSNCGENPGGRFKNSYELLNLRALKISMLYKNHVFQCMSMIFCAEFQRVPLKFHTKYHTHTLKDVDFIRRWRFKSS